MSSSCEPAISNYKRLSEYSSFLSLTSFVTSFTLLKFEIFPFVLIMKVITIWTVADVVLVSSHFYFMTRISYTLVLVAGG